MPKKLALVCTATHPRCAGPAGCSCTRDRRTHRTRTMATRAAEVLRESVQLSSGVRLQLHHWGRRGPLVLLHHGSGFCAGIWRKTAEALAEHFHVVAFDARGHGDSDKPERGYTWQVFAADYRELTEQLLRRSGAPRIALAVGHSFGATVTLSVAQRAPELFGALCLFEPVLMSPEVYAQRLRSDGSSWLSLMTRLRQARFESRHRARELLATTELFKSWQPEVLEDYLTSGFEQAADGHVTLKCPPAIEAQLFEMGPSDRMFSSQPIAVPSLLERAQHGWFAPDHYARYRRLFVDLTETAADSCHCIPMHAPEHTARRVCEFAARFDL